MAKIYLLLALLCSGPVWAQAELYDAQEDAIRVGWRLGFESTRVDLPDVEPAAGPATESKADLQNDLSSQVVVDVPEKKEVSATEGGEAKPAAEGEKAAEGKAEGEGEKEAPKKSSKKEPEPAFPSVRIGGKLVVTHAMQVADDVSASTPAGLRAKGMDEVLGNRANIVPYAHNPMKGASGAPIQVVLFEDLACADCLPVMGKIDAALADYSSQTQVVHVHVPSKRFQDTDLPAFYGKVAQRQGKFWEYRAALIAANTVDDKAIFDMLLKTGIPERDVRALMISDARRFYRELDADTTLARNFAVGRPPVVFINGIRLGSGGLPIERLSDVLFYVKERLSRGLPEPGP